MPMRQLLLLALVGSVLGGCSATDRHLIDPQDLVRYQLSTTPAAEGWTALGFDDSAWPLGSGELQPSTAQAGGSGGLSPTAPGAEGSPAVLRLRRRFDVGPLADAYRQLSLELPGEGAFQVFLNGQALAEGDAQAPRTVTLDLPAELLRSSGNLLAVELHPVDPSGLLSVGLVLDGQPDATVAPGRIVKGPYLLAPAPDGITIAWETDVAMPSQAVVDGKPIDGGSGTHHAARVSGLLPSHAYRYHVRVGARSSDEAELTTAPRPGERVRFVVYGDNRTDGDAHRRVVEAVLAEGPDFILNSGDLVDKSIPEEWQLFFDIEYPLLMRTPLYAALGNHEADTDAGRFVSLFSTGDAGVFSGRVYSGDYGDVHVAVLDSNGDLGQQASWLDQDLSAAEARGLKHSFVVLHWGPYSSGTKLRHGSNDDAKAHIAPVARAHRVDAILSGHDHFYERGDADGLAYIVAGGGGAPLGGEGRIRETQVVRSAFHYLVVDVVGSIVEISARDLAGTTFDSLRIER